MSATAGTLYGIGVGPGDPELITLKAARLIAAAAVVAYPSNPEGASRALAVGEPHIAPTAGRLPLVMDFAPDRRSALAAYDAGAIEIAAHLAAGRDVAVLCEGDPLFYGSFTYLLEKLAGQQIVVVPGVTSPAACAAVAARPLSQGDETFLALPATLPEDRLTALLAVSDAVAVMKIGRHLAKVARALTAAGLADGARCVVDAGSADQRVLTLPEAEASGVPYFSLILSRRRRT